VASVTRGCESEGRDNKLWIKNVKLFVFVGGLLLILVYKAFQTDTNKGMTHGD